MEILYSVSTNRDTRGFCGIEVSNQNVINAYSFPGGWTIITQKMINFCESGEDISPIAFVVAYEYGHFINEDFLRKYDKEFGTNLLFQIGASFSNYNATIDGAIIANLAQEIVKDYLL